MDSTYTRYLELWHQAGSRHHRALCQTRLGMTRNGVESSDFNMCTGLGRRSVDRSAIKHILKPWVSDIRVKRNGEYLFVR